MKISANRKTIRVLTFILLEGLITLGWFNRSSLLPYLTLGAFLLLSSILILAQRSSLPGQIGISPLLILLSVYTLYRVLSITFAPLPLHGLEVISRDIFLLILFGVLLVSYSRYWGMGEFESSILILAGIFTTVNLIIIGLKFIQILNVSGLPLLPTLLAYRLPGGFLIHPNFEAGFLNLVIPFALVQGYRSGNQRTKTLLTALIFSFLVVEYFCSSRGAWISLLGSGFVTVSLVWLSRFENIGSGIRAFLKLVTPRRIAAAVIVLAIATFCFSQLLAFEVAQRSHSPIATARTGIWKIGLNVVSESPILGSGPGSFHYLSAWFSNIPPGFFLSHAHNVWIQILAESGVPGLLLALGMAAFILRSMIRIWNSKDGGMRMTLIPIAGALTGLVIHNLVDFTFDVPLISFLFICFLVILDRTEPRERSTKLSLATFGFLLLVGSSLYLLLAWWNHRGANLMSEGVAAAREDDWTIAASRICEAEQNAPGYTFYGFQCGLALATAAERNDDAGLLAPAIEVYRYSLLADPYWPVHRANLAALEFKTGETTRAINDLAAASQQAMRNITLLVNLGWMYEQTGQSQLAENTYLQALDLDPWLIRSSYMQNSALRRVLSQSMQSAISEDPALQPALFGWLHLDQGEYGQAALVFEHNLELDPADEFSHAGMALALALQDGPSERADQHLDLAAFYSRGSYLLQDAAGLVALIRGEHAKARDYFLTVFEMLRDRNESVNFYANMYPRAFLPGDSVPQLISAPVPGEVFQHLLWLAGELERSGDNEQAAGIRDWVALQRRY
jgi:O-antigen ligase/tetratricopeptide (TPR) repeat protein